MPSTVTPVFTTYWGSSTPTHKEWLHRDAWGLLIFNVKNAVGLGMLMEEQLHRRTHLSRSSLARMR